MYKSMKVNKNCIELSFTGTGSGLMSSDGKPLNWFTITGVDKNFVPAEAVIKGNKIIVRSEKVLKPVAVRFAWDETAMPNLCNKEKLPASPFRTDHWK
jgi:sialate O-acetylesterase